MENVKKDFWDQVTEDQEAAAKATADREKNQALEAEKLRQEQAARWEKARLAREAQAKACKEAQAKARADKEAYDQKMTNLAEAGDIDAIMAELDYVLSDPDERFAQAMGWIRYGLQVAASKAPQRLYAFLGARKAAFEGFLLIRSQIMAMNLIREHDAKAGAPYYGQLPKEVVEVWIPRLENIGKSVSETVTTFSRADHALKLANGKKDGKKTGANHEHDISPERKPSRTPPSQGNSTPDCSELNPLGTAGGSPRSQGDAGPAGGAAEAA